MTWIQTIILGLIEGLTEYLPISSTGHLVIATSAMGLESTDFLKAFNVIIQSGAILAVLVLYWRRFLVSKDIYIKLFVSFVPTAIIGFALKNLVDQWLESNLVVAVSLILGGVFFFWLEKKYLPKTAVFKKLDDLSLKTCAFIGVTQSLALVPGVSRSGASIAAGLFAGLNRQDATEFSFLLAVPTLLAATAYKSLKIYPIITNDMISHLVVGTLVSFVVAVIAIKGFVHFLNRHGFIPFAYYRVILGILIILFLRN